METLAISSDLQQEYTFEIAQDLNTLLADFQIHYMNLRGLHWNIKGEKFFVLHEKFEELYEAASNTVDELAERVLSLGHSPLHTFSKYLDNSELQIIEDVSDANQGILALVANLKSLLRKERYILAKSSEVADESTSNILSDLISGQEKLIWMLTAYLG